MRRTLVLALSVALLSTACGRGDPLSDTTSKLETIRSGTLSFGLIASAPRQPGAEVGFRLEGPFALHKGALPVARLDYTEFAGSEKGTATVTSTGQRAFLTLDGTAYELPPERAAELREPPGRGPSKGGLDVLRIDRWVERPVVSAGGLVGGTETDRVAGAVNVPNALNDLFELAARLGAAPQGTSRLQGDAAAAVQRAVRSSGVEVFTGKKDRLLRRLVLTVEFGVEAPPELATRLGPYAAARLSLDLSIGDPNRPVTVGEPENPRPFAELPTRR